MQAFIVSDVAALTNAVRAILHREGHDCPADHLVAVAGAADHPKLTDAEIVVVALLPDVDKALRTVAELHNASKAPILAVGPTKDSQLVLRTLRMGAVDFIGEEDLQGDLIAALGRLQSEQSIQQEPARTIAVLASSGGCGSSTLAANIATALAKEHQSTLLVDLKLHSGDLAALLDLKPTHTIAELCQHASLMDRVMLERSLVKHASGVSLLAPPRVFPDTAFVTAAGVRQTLALARNLFPYVVLDLDHTFGEEQIQALRQADTILIVLRLEFTCLRQTRRTLNYLTQIGISLDRMRLVVNRYGQAQEVPAAQAEEALGLKVFHYIPDDPKAVNRANNNGVPVILENPWAKVSKSMSKLAGSINGRPH